MGKMKDLTGCKFGQLTVLECAGKLDGRRYSWRCLCDCGKEVTVLGASLTSGNTKSCGCQKYRGIKKYNQEQSQNSIVPNGTRFGKLVVIEDLGYREQVPGHSRRWYRCKCDCGNTKDVMGNQLKQGQTQSCGQCSFHSKGEHIIKHLLEKNNILFLHDSQWPELYLETGRRLRFDFILLNKNGEPVRFIEYDGRQHYMGPDEGLWSQSDSLETIQERDQIKNNYCQKHNYPLVRIPYTKEKITLDDLLGNKYLIKGDDVGDG